MKKSKIHSHSTYLLLGTFTFVLSGQLSVLAQSAKEGQGAQYIEPAENVQASDTVTINVKDANISEVLKAYSLQTGQSIVVGPDVVSDNVNVRLNNIPWKEALDVILKPYGFGYRVVGGTIVISKLENIVEVEGIEPLGSKVFNLRYLDAYDIKEVCEAQLSGRGKFTILSNTGLPGWAFGGSGAGSSSSGAATEGGIRSSRTEKDQIRKSKTFVITDVPASLTAVSEIIEKMDQLPEQVLIEAKFLEINTDGLSDIGLDYITAMQNVTPLTLGTGGAGTLQPSALPGQFNNLLNATTGYPDPLQMGAAGSLSQDNGLRLSFADLGDSGYDMLYKLIATDGDANVLSAPRVLTLNNQKASILVGEKYPIVNTDVSSAGGSQTQSESLDYYENIGIQLNVIPQVCDERFINMIVHPAVSEKKVGATIGNNQYPILKIREAETQVMIKSGNTAVIGGLQSDRESQVIQKIPFLGDIPFIGRLFRRETTTKEKIDLLIFIKASIIDEMSYAKASLASQEAMNKAMDKTQKAEAAVVPVAESAAFEPAAMVVEAAPASATPEVEATPEEKDELVAYISGKSATNDVPETANTSNM
ncbi:MAG: secretin and TonB N-terminal domain-containing protein [Kiritimatiellales bacterium]|nr:secretin and TonB N-terminal domain-containing protein [Kiritimatiellales bacterium]MCF7864066.1 secretin and TonB N-terminal domain-containing protein [Kiritimatiellales bacterium]